MTGPKVCWAASCKKLFWAVYLVCYLLCFLCAYLSTVTHTRKCLHAAEVISGLTKVKGEGGDLIQNESQFNRVRKKDNNKKSICHQHSVYHVRKRKYQLSTPPTFFCATSAGWNRSWMLIDPFYFRLLLKQKCPWTRWQGSMDLVQISGPWTRLQGVHGPGPKLGGPCPQVDVLSSPVRKGQSKDKLQNSKFKKRIAHFHHSR